jgi:hypothetical protein
MRSTFKVLQALGLAVWHVQLEPAVRKEAYTCEESHSRREIKELAEGNKEVGEMGVGNGNEVGDEVGMKWEW